jgi:hypothetical protein
MPAPYCRGSGISVKPVSCQRDSLRLPHVPTCALDSNIHSCVSRIAVRTDVVASRHSRHQSCRFLWFHCSCTSLMFSQGGHSRSDKSPIKRPATTASTQSDQRHAMGLATGLEPAKMTRMTLERISRFISELEHFRDPVRCHAHLLGFTRFAGNRGRVGYAFSVLKLYI